MKALEAGGWLGGLSYTGPAKQSTIKYNGSGGSSYVATNDQTLIADNSEATVVSSTMTTGGGASYATDNSYATHGETLYNGLPGSASIKWVSK